MLNELQQLGEGVAPVILDFPYHPKIALLSSGKTSIAVKAEFFETGEIEPFTLCVLQSMV